MSEKLRHAFKVHVRVLDSKTGVVEYTASTEALDSYREVIRAKGWLFDNAKDGMPFIDSHNYGTIGNSLGSVKEHYVKAKELVNVAQWAVEVPTNTMAIKGFQMTEAGHLNRVSVGFFPVKAVSKWDEDKTRYSKELERLGMTEENGPRVIYLEQQQVELSAVLLGANHEAVARAYKEGILDDADLERFSGADVAAKSFDEHVARQRYFSATNQSKTARNATDPADALRARQRERRARQLEAIHKIIKSK